MTTTDYQNAKLPWFEIYDDSLATLTGAATLKIIDSVAALGIKKGEAPLTGEAGGPQGNVVPLSHPERVRIGEF